MKKIINRATLFIVTIISLCIIVPFSRALSDYKIEITGSSSVHTYGAWQIFKGNVHDGVLSDIDWGTGIEDPSAFLTALKQDSLLKNHFIEASDAYDVVLTLSEIVTSDDADEIKQFAEVVNKYLQADKVVNSSFSENKHTISGLDAGYYFIKDVNSIDVGSAATRYILKVTNDTAIKVKADAPTLTKQVSHHGLEDFHDTISAESGALVTFKLTGTLPDTYADYKTYYYHFIDNLPSGLDYIKGSLKVTIDGVDATDMFTTTNDDTLDIAINDLATLNASFHITEETKIVVTYDAMVLNPTLGLIGNMNTAMLEYSSNPNADHTSDRQKTVQAEATIYTYQLEINKINSKNNDALSGVKFRLYKYENGVKKYAKVENGFISAWVLEDDIASATELETKDGKITIAGLASGTYYLNESYTLPGYNSISDLKLVIEDTLSVDGSLTSELKDLTVALDGGEKVKGDLTSGKVSITVKNVPGILLPSTGGIGVIVIYALGISLVVLSITLIIKRKHE